MSKKKDDKFVISARVLTSIQYIMTIRELVSMTPEEAEKLIRWAQRFEGMKIDKLEKEVSKRKIKISASLLRRFANEYEEIVKEFGDFRSMLRTLRKGQVENE